jgi:hypothetical protein
MSSSAFSDNQLNILKKYKTSFKDADILTRQSIILNVGKEFLELEDEEFYELSKEDKEVVLAVRDKKNS